ncbi:hypothetical protein BHM03_00032305 [Ensete ventricosum]|nr:hypothetical protein BHM03_00032305 [Ensete ventricosum]
MAQSKDDIKYGAAQAKLSDDEMLRVGYKHGTPLESGKISDAEPVDLFVDARRISEATKNARPAEDDPNSGGLSCQGSHHTCNSHGLGSHSYRTSWVRGGGVRKGAKAHPFPTRFAQRPTKPRGGGGGGGRGERERAEPQAGLLFNSIWRGRGAPLAKPRNPKEKSGCKRAQEKPNLLPYSPQKKMSSSAPLPFLGCIS